MVKFVFDQNAKIEVDNCGRRLYGELVQLFERHFELAAQLLHRSAAAFLLDAEYCSKSRFVIGWIWSSDRVSDTTILRKQLENKSVACKIEQLSSLTGCVAAWEASESIIQELLVRLLANLSIY